MRGFELESAAQCSPKSAQHAIARCAMESGSDRRKHIVSNHRIRGCFFRLSRHHGNLRLETSCVFHMTIRQQLGQRCNQELEKTRITNASDPVYHVYGFLVVDLPPDFRTF